MKQGPSLPIRLTHLRAPSLRRYVREGSLPIGGRQRGYIIPLGKAVFEVLKTAARDGPFVRWQTEDSIAKQSPQLLGEFHAVIGRLIRSGQAAEEVLSQAFDTLDALKERGAASLTYGERLNILFSALSMVRPSEAGPLKITRFNEAWDKLTGEL